MKDIDIAMKYFLVFSIANGIAAPLLLEFYANISKTIALIIYAALIIFSAVKFSSLSAKNAFLGISAAVFSSPVFCGFGFMFIHPAVKKTLENISKYFLTLQDAVYCWAQMAVIMLMMFPLCGVIKLIRRHINNDKTADSIDNAFSEEDS